VIVVVGNLAENFLQFSKPNIVSVFAKPQQAVGATFLQNIARLVESSSK